MFFFGKKGSGKVYRAQRLHIHKTGELKRHVYYLAETIGERSVFHYKNLEQTAQYIETELSKNDIDYQIQTFKIKNVPYKNIYVKKEGLNSDAGAIIVGAHYDTIMGTPGADDNASAVAVLLELIKQFKSVKTNHPMIFVFFTLEEPPSFGDSKMGSHIFARALRKKNEKVHFMISLEMLGFYSERKIQEYPSPILEHTYPKKGNFIAVVGTHEYGVVTNEFYENFSRNISFNAEILIAPASLPGVDFSDHRSFWAHDYPAFMITDTAFYRNKNYHKKTDTPGTLNYKKMNNILNGLYLTFKEM